MKTNTRLRDSKAPLYLQLTEDVRDQIRSGALKPGDKLPSISELRQSYGICKSTIERAHQLLEQENIVVRRQGQGTFVTEAAGKAQHVIAVSPELLGDQQSPYWFKMLQGICRAAEKHHAEVIFSPQGRSKVWDRADGVLVTDLSENLREAPAGFPLVSLLWPVERAKCVVADDYAGSWQLTQHLLRLGHRNIALLIRKANPSPIADARLQAHRDALRAHGIEVNERFVRYHAVEEARTDGYEPYMRAGSEHMEQWLREGWRELGCTAVMAYNDGTAIGVMHALQQAGISVPGDVSVTGFDGVTGLDSFRIPLTTIHVPLAEIGAAGVELMMQRLQNDDAAPERTEIAVQLIEGESTARARGL